MRTAHPVLRDDETIRFRHGFVSLTKIRDRMGTESFLPRLEILMSQRRPPLCRSALFLVLTLVPLSVLGQEPTWFARQSEWNGYAQFHFTVADRPAYIVAPQKAAAGNPWIWRARFPGFHAEMDVELLGQGFHVAYVDVAGLFGSPQAVRIGDAFYEYLTTERGFAKKPALEGVSRGGLFVYNWAARHPDKVACIYCDTPVCDIKSWPGGKGQGVGAPREWEACKTAYGLTEEEALAFANNPLDAAQTLADAAIPLLTIVSENDEVVPPSENTYLLQERLAKLGHPLEVISVAAGTEESHGHHFAHPDPQRVVKFLARHASVNDQQLASDRMAMLTRAKRVVLLGDSITYAADQWSYVDAWLQAKSPDHRPPLINVGLPSETVSGLSEDGHAGGRFPRPVLAERLERVLDVTKPDLVFACYGINCGIYQPYDETRFERYKTGIQQLKKQVEAAHAKLILITPPTFDDQRQDNAFSYDAVMSRYSAWLVAQREQGWIVIDLHGPMARALAERRTADADFTFQPDAVHPNSAGHWLIASEIIRWLGDDESADLATADEMLKKNRVSSEQYRAIRKRMHLLRDAYLSAAGHKRPGVKAGLPLDQAESQAEDLSKRLR